MSYNSSKTNSLEQKVIARPRNQQSLQEKWEKTAVTSLLETSIEIMTYV
jgi:hypothetical protein